jgi:hypothetical protein
MLTSLLVVHELGTGVYLRLLVRVLGGLLFDVIPDPAVPLLFLLVLFLIVDVSLLLLFLVLVVLLEPLVLAVLLDRRGVVLGLLDLVLDVLEKTEGLLVAVTHFVIFKSQYMPLHAEHITHYLYTLRKHSIYRKEKNEGEMNNEPLMRMLVNLFC